ncbi:SMP-30/gluconolactonase/LRE family protein [Massilia sp. MB5]|uniref:SMP-30/gluconolactonase/LRE family protein n=1 Tax=Massilia sp. MB5 TaxID=2919578 RepID=UPI001F0FDE52|nr:SMP-30/gluconolactonase/LRE family protein [Massilia sp. MB5]UMR30699.1 SMP-30/gluconolactonase/LRE family protein [Massilia sp. MB5]
MNEYSIRTACDEAMVVGECPLWHAAEQALYWVDIEGFAIHRLHPASGARRSWKMATEPSAIARAERGGLMVALRSGFAHLDTESGALTEVAPAPFDMATTRFNDGKTDAAGRFWCGTIYEPRDKPAAEMYCLERGQLRKIWSGGMTVSNGLGFSPDGRTMYHADTTSHRVTRFDFDPLTGQVWNERDVRRFPTDKASSSYGGRPDGAAVDSEGNYWVAMFEGGRVLKLSPAGEQLDEISLPVRCPTMVAFGGPALRTLYITSAGKRPAAELAQLPLSGRVLAVEVAVAGREEAAYRD